MPVTDDDVDIEILDRLLGTTASITGATTLDDPVDHYDAHLDGHTDGHGDIPC